MIFLKKYDEHFNEYCRHVTNIKKEIRLAIKNNDINKVKSILPSASEATFRGIGVILPQDAALAGRIEILELFLNSEFLNKYARKGNVIHSGSITVFELYKKYGLVNEYTFSYHDIFMMIIQNHFDLAFKIIEYSFNQSPYDFYQDLLEEEWLIEHLVKDEKYCNEEDFKIKKQMELFFKKVHTFKSLVNF